MTKRITNLRVHYTSPTRLAEIFDQVKFLPHSLLHKILRVMQTY